MKAQPLGPDSFDQYPPLAKAVAVANIAQLRMLPKPVLASFLAEISRFDYKFPGERNELSSRLEALAHLSRHDLEQLLSPFASITLSDALEKLDYINSPGLFIEEVSAYFWASGKIDAYRTAAQQLIEGLAVPPPTQTIVPLVAIVTAPELASSRYPTFHKLKNLGLHATNIHDPAGEQYLATLLQQRANRNPAPYRHWFLDTAGASGPGGTVTYLSYRQSDPIRRAVVSVMQHAVVSGTGPEWLRSKMATLTPAECNADAITSDLVLQHFILDLFANGSGTQVYSTSFAQWSAREIIRRAKPQTLFIKIGSRVRQQSLNELIAATGNALQLDHAGSLIDADLAVHYTWLEVAKLPGANKAVFCAWYPGHGEAFIIGPGIPRGVSTANPIGIADLINMTA